MDDNNKNNLHFFAADSMRDMHRQLTKWQAENQKRFLSLEIQHDEGQFCCLALTNPTEVVIMARKTPYPYSSYEEVLRGDKPFA